MQAEDDEIIAVSCDRCAATYQTQRAAIGPNGCKARCPDCSGPLLVFSTSQPSPELVDSTTVDLPLTPVESLGIPVHPVGSVPPRLDEAVDAHTALSVTPPPVRRAGGAGAFSTRVLMSPPPARPSNAVTAAPATPRPPRHPRPTPSPPEPPRAVTSPGAPRRDGFAVSTHPGVQNRTGATGGASSTRGPEVFNGSMSYAPPWGATPGPFSAAASPYTHPGVPTMPPVAARTPMMMAYGTPWGVPTMVAPPDPRWVPAVVLGMERGTLLALLLVVLLVGVVGALLGITGQNYFSPSTVTPIVVHAEARRLPPLQVLPPKIRWEAEPRLPQLQVRPRPAPLTLPVPQPSKSPFSVESSDVRDPWAED